MGLTGSGQGQSAEPQDADVGTLQKPGCVPPHGVSPVLTDGYMCQLRVRLLTDLFNVRFLCAYSAWHRAVSWDQDNERDVSAGLKILIASEEKQHKAWRHQSWRLAQIAVGVCS